MVELLVLPCASANFWAAFITMDRKRIYTLGTIATWGGLAVAAAGVVVFPRTFPLVGLALFIAGCACAGVGAVAMTKNRTVGDQPAESGEAAPKNRRDGLGVDPMTIMDPLEPWRPKTAEEIEAEGKKLGKQGRE